MKRWLSVGAVLLLAGAVFWYVRDRQQPTNVLLITADTTRQDDLGVYGGPARTPHLQELRDDGILFHHVYSVAYGTTPSHASLFTSIHPRSHGVYNNQIVLPDQFLTLSEVMASHGAVTAAFVSSTAVRRELGLGQGFDSFEQQFEGFQRKADDTMDRAVDWLQGVEGPFFAWIHLNEPHWPYVPLHEFGMRYLPDDEEIHKPGAYGQFNRELKPQELLRRGREHFDEHDRLARGLYRGEIEFMDRQMGRAIRVLKSRRMYDRTVIVFVADHGENFGEPDPQLAFGHALLHQHVVRLPLVIKLPHSRWAGEEHSFLAENIDIAPSLIDILGFDAVPSWTGESMLPALSERRSSFRDYVVLESAHKKEISVRTHRWVYRRQREDAPVESHLGPLQFYDLATDPVESKNIYGAMQPEAQTAFDRLDRISRQFLRDAREVTPETLDSPEHIEALKALGYVQ